MEPLSISSLHGHGYSQENTDTNGATTDNNEHSAGATIKPVAQLNDQGLAQLAHIRATYDGQVKDQVVKVTVAEGLARELVSSTPFQGLSADTLVQVKSMAEHAETTLEDTRRQVLESNRQVVEQAASNVEQYTSYKRNREESLPHITDAQNKRQRVEQGVAALTEVMSASPTSDNAELLLDATWLATTLNTTEGCKRLLDRQMTSMQEMKKEKNIVAEDAERLHDEIAPLQAAVHELREVAGGGSEHDNNPAELNVAAELKETCSWYENVNRLMCAVSGTSIDFDQAGNDALSNDDYSLRIRLDSCSALSADKPSSTVLVLHFVPNTTTVLAAELDPPIAPLSDIVASCSGLEKEDDTALHRLLREARVRIEGSYQREIEFRALRNKFVVQWNYGGVTRGSQPEAAAWLYVRVTIPGVGIIVEMRAPPDYPQQYTDVMLTQVVGVMGWTKNELKELENMARSCEGNTVTSVVEHIEKAIKATKIPTDVA